MLKTLIAKPRCSELRRGISDGTVAANRGRPSACVTNIAPLNIASPPVISLILRSPTSATEKHPPEENIMSNYIIRTGNLATTPELEVGVGVHLLGVGGDGEAAIASNMRG